MTNGPVEEWDAREDRESARAKGTHGSEEATITVEGEPGSLQEELLGGADEASAAWEEDTPGRSDEASDGPADSKQEDQMDPWLRLYALVRSGVLSLGALLGVLCILVFGVSLLFGVRPLVVVSGSMEPTIPVGSVVFSAQVAAGDIDEGTIVTVERPRGLGLVTHRMVKSVEPMPGLYEYTLRGDANAQEDPEPYRLRTAGKYLGHVVGLGYLAGFLQSTSGLFVAGAVGLALIALFILDPVRMRNGLPARTRRD
ncbi:signal peptidase I [Arthrobacter sp. M4]|uniref:signal peptidase I n=1 Tax=Arthrobacter sp. M4 TaxID=218160 RepID=UPI001CDC69AE|nr:signal peptidase I [Arthrobacter sp. M4]MCA4134036.1 signal peptidase I [Arthrobacter sp. M4]